MRLCLKPFTSNNKHLVIAVLMLSSNAMNRAFPFGQA